MAALHRSARLLATFGNSRLRRNLAVGPGIGKGLLTTLNPPLTQVTLLSAPWPRGRGVVTVYAEAHPISAGGAQKYFEAVLFGSLMGPRRARDAGSRPSSDPADRCSRRSAAVQCSRLFSKSACRSHQAASL